MASSRNGTVAALAVVTCFLASPSLAEELEEIVGQHMVAAALLTAHLVAIAEKAGLGREEIRGILKDVADNSVIDEFWITDDDGDAVLTNQDVSFTFSPDPAEQPQASAFWPLLTGDQQVVIQEAQKREIDDQIFKYVGVAGIDQRRIVQVGITADNIATPE